MGLVAGAMNLVVVGPQQGLIHHVSTTAVTSLIQGLVVEVTSRRRS
jgi:hypothetical protein